MAIDTKFTLAHKTMKIKQLADQRMEIGGREHSSQVWEDLTREYKDQELREELADAWNYAEGHEDQDLIRFYLEKVYKLI